MEILRRQTAVPPATDRPPGIADPDGTPITACALTARADMFVPIDKALLELKVVENLPIMSPPQSWERPFSRG